MYLESFLHLDNIMIFLPKAINAVSAAEIVSGSPASTTTITHNLQRNVLQKMLQL